MLVESITQVRKALVYNNKIKFYLLDLYIDASRCCCQECRCNFFRKVRKKQILDGVLHGQRSAI